LLIQHFNLEPTKFLAAAITPEDDNKAIISPTCKQGPIMRKSQCVDGISMLDKSPLQ